MKKLNVIKFGSMMVAALALGACGSSSSSETSSGESANKEVGILLPVEHDALNKAADGFIAGLASGGFKEGENLTIDRRNALGNDDTMRNLAKSLVNSSDLVLGLGTGASQALKAAQRTLGTSKPLMFSAVTDPVDAGLVEELANPKGLMTGSSDAQPVAEQISLVKRCLPDADKVGIFYTQSESNSEIQARQAKSAIEEAGMEAIIRTCTDINDLSASFASLLGNDGLDAIYLPTDNNVASNMARIKEAVSGKGVLLVAGEVGMLENGAHITLSVDYMNLGIKTGEMAAKILKGEKTPGELPVYSMTADECEKFISSDSLADAGVTVPESVLEEFTDIDEE